jgi:hypothetical protein
MRLTGILLAVFVSSCAFGADEVCGLYQMSEFRDRTVHALIDFASAEPRAITLTITNPNSPAARPLVNNYCYCVSGKISPDPAYRDNPMYYQLHVNQIVVGPFVNCGPRG